MNTIPDCSTRRVASPTTVSMSTSRAASSWVSSFMASGIFTVFRLDCLGSRLENISLMFDSISSIPCGVSTSIIGVMLWVNSTSTERSSSFPARSILRSFSRVAGDGRSATWPPSVSPSSGAGGSGNNRSSTRSSARSLALTWTFSCSSSRTILTARSMRSRMMDSTSLPT